MRLIVDASEISRHDAGTGIQRVFHRRFSFLRDRLGSNQLLTVYAGKLRSGYRICEAVSTAGARHLFTRTRTRYKPSPGDVFFALDYHSYVQTAQRRFFGRLKRLSVPLVFLVHDALPYTNPEWFPGNTARRRRHWERYLKLLSKADLLFAVSRTTATFLTAWFRERAISPRPRIRVLPNGAELIDNDLKVATPKACFRNFFLQARQHNFFLMVGTLEPRKGYPLVLEAFERIWSRPDNSIGLIIVGKHGWSLSEFAERLRTHPEMGSRLHWFTLIGDDFLSELYKSCSCLITASYGEGFGLPVAEAMAFGLPVLARDIPVFREVAGDYATFFHTDDSQELAAIISAFQLSLPSADRPRRLPITTSWKDSSESMLGDLLRLATRGDAETANAT